MRQKAVLDTSFLVEHFRKGTVQEIFFNLNKYYHITFSAVVLMELLSGAFDKKNKSSLNR